MSSIRVRYIAVFIMTTGIYIAVSWTYVNHAFERYVWGHEVLELGHEIDALVRAVTVARGDVTMAQVPSSRYEQPYAGAYWQVHEDERVVVRSRSLWDFVLSVPDRGGVGEEHVHELAGPNGSRLLALERVIAVRSGERDTRIRVVAAVEKTQYQKIISGFHKEISFYIFLLIVMFIAGAVLQLFFILRPFRSIRDEVGRANSDPGWRLHERYPVEIRPLVEQINRLLDTREAARDRARHAAADLAHGLKTPVAGLQALGRSLRRAGQVAIAEDIARQADVIHRRTMYELVRAKSLFAGPGPVRPIPVEPVLTKLKAALLRTTSRDIEIHTAISPDRRIEMSEDDALEVFGVLFDNACKWARSQVTVTDRIEDGVVAITVADDGTGGAVAGSLGRHRRGVRFDTETAGTGFGLAIAREIVEAHGGTLSFAAEPGGGLAASVRLPIASDAAEAGSGSGRRG